MDYNKRNRKPILNKAHDKYHNGGGKEKAKKYYKENKEAIKKRERKMMRNDEISKGFIGYNDESVIPSGLSLPQMSGWIKYFENGGKNMSFKIDDDEVYLKYYSIWNKMKELLIIFKLVI